MFGWWGERVARWRWPVIGVVAAGLLGMSLLGLGHAERLSSGGMFDPGSESAQASRLADAAFGRNHDVDVVVLYVAPPGKTVDDPHFAATVVASLNELPRRYPDQIAGVNAAYWPTETGKLSGGAAATPDRTRAVAALALRGDDDTAMLRNYRIVKDAFAIPGIDVRVGGLQPVAGALNDTIAADIHRMELLAFPAVGVLLFFVFGGLVAAALPLVVGGLTVFSAFGIVRLLTEVTEVNTFVSPVVSMIGLGLAIDYGLFVVSRFREELAEGHDTAAAVRRTVTTAGRTVLFSAIMIVASLGGLLLFPQGFLKSIGYGAMATVSMAALTAVTILPALLAVLGRRVDAGGLKRFTRTRTAEEVEAGFWGRSTRWVMRHPRAVAVPLVVLLIALIIPIGNLIFGGFSEKYLPPDNPTRLAQTEIDTTFPDRRSDPIELIFTGRDTTAIGALLREANGAPGLADPFPAPTRSPGDPEIFRTSTTLVDSGQAGTTVDHLRGLDRPEGVRMLVGGMPALQYDTINALLYRLPIMIALVVLVTTVLMLLTFGSLVLPIKAALMSALGLGSTLGILTWIFVDGHGAGLLNFTPQPIQANILVVIMAVVYGLSTDYEVFLLSRMVEARARGASTTDAVRIGTAHTGRIITAAALILLVVVGAFALSDLVMMQYIAYGMIAALVIDATLLRMLLVPATMRLLGDRCWWAPAWLERWQRRAGLGEVVLDDEPPGPATDLVPSGPVRR
ncbi:MMPL family transporter [Nocardia thailandica]|uniref:MMPL family transporter n=1 Tax=Nocardia thailandica TaxID=257275 RepID=A0ABW6PV50_9NOCA